MPLNRLLPATFVKFKEPPGGTAEEVGYKGSDRALCPLLLKAGFLLSGAWIHRLYADPRPYMSSPKCLGWWLDPGGQSQRSACKRQLERAEANAQTHTYIIPCIDREWQVSKTSRRQKSRNPTSCSGKARPGPVVGWLRHRGAHLIPGRTCPHPQPAADSGQPRGGGGGGRGHYFRSQADECPQGLLTAPNTVPHAPLASRNAQVHRALPETHVPGAS